MYLAWPFSGINGLIRTLTGINNHSSVRDTADFFVSKVSSCIRALTLMLSPPSKSLSAHQSLVLHFSLRFLGLPPI